MLSHFLPLAGRRFLTCSSCQVRLRTHTHTRTHIQKHPSMMHLRPVCLSVSLSLSLFSRCFSSFPFPSLTSASQSQGDRINRTEFDRVAGSRAYHYVIRSQELPLLWHDSSPGRDVIESKSLSDSNMHPKLRVQWPDMLTLSCPEPKASNRIQSSQHRILEPEPTALALDSLNF